MELYDYDENKWENTVRHVEYKHESDDFICFRYAGDSWTNIEHFIGNIIERAELYIEIVDKNDNVVNSNNEAANINYRLKYFDNDRNQFVYINFGDWIITKRIKDDDVKYFFTSMPDRIFKTFFNLKELK